MVWRFIKYFIIFNVIWIVGFLGIVDVIDGSLCLDNCLKDNENEFVNRYYYYSLNV